MREQNGLRVRLYAGSQYMVASYVEGDLEWKKGSAELLVLSLLEA